MRKPILSFLIVAHIFALGALIALGAPADAQTVPLPSWNDGPAKQAIIQFVQDTTDKASPNFVPPEAALPPSIRTERCGWSIPCTRR